MRIFNLLLIFCLLSIFSFGQSPITLTQSDMPSPGDTLRYSVANPSNLDLTQTGPNQIWDYSTLVPTSQSREDYVYALQTAYAFYFLSANSYGTKIGDSLGGGPFTFTDVYTFFKSVSGKYSAEGIGFRYQGVPLAAYYSDEDELFQFPMDYLDRDSSTYAFSVSLGGNISYSQKGYRINEVDGWGRITTPFGTFDCLRLVSTTIGKDSVNYNGFSFSFPNELRTYKFMANGEKIPVLEVTTQLQSGGPSTIRRVRYRDQYREFVGVDEPTIQALEVYPNPGTNRMIVRWDRPEAGNMEVISMDGRVLQTMQVVQGQNTLPIDGLSAGMYLLQIRTADGQSVHQARVIVAE